MKNLYEKIKSKVLILLLLGFVNLSYSQEVIIKAEDYKQEFKGVGMSIGLYIYYHFSMSSSNQVKAIDYINKDLNMNFIQDYIKEYPSEAQYYDVRANYIKKAIQHKPNSQIAMVYDNFPKELRTDIVVNGNTVSILDYTKASIYDDLANWYFLSLKGFQD